MYKAFGTSYFHDFVDDVEDNPVAFFQRGAVAVSVELVRTGVLSAGIFYNIGVFVALGNFRMGVGDVLDMAEALHLGDDFKAEITGVIEKFTNLVLFQQLPICDPVAVRECGLPEGMRAACLRVPHGSLQAILRKFPDGA